MAQTLKKSSFQKKNNCIPLNRKSKTKKKLKRKSLYVTIQKHRSLFFSNTKQNMNKFVKARNGFFFYFF